MVSIITPTYNSEKYIEDTIRSILNQTYSNWELIITDDCSNDNTVKIIENHSKRDKRIKLIKLKKNFGAGHARNTSINKSIGRYIAFCDSDDIWDHRKLELQIEKMKIFSEPLSFSYYDEINEEGSYSRTIKSPKRINYKKQLKNDYIGFSTLIFDTEILGKPLMSNLRKRQDYLYKLVLLKKCKNISVIEKSLMKYRLRSNSISRKKMTLIKYNYLVYRELKFSHLKSFYHFISFIYYYFLKKMKVKLNLPL